MSAAMIRVPRGLLLWLLAGTGCSANKGSDSGTPKQTVADLELRFAVLDDTNADGKLTPGESGFLHFIIQNNGDQNLVEIMGSVELHDDRLSGWYHEERWWGMAFADASNSDANILTGQSYYGEEVTLDRFDAGEAGTRINGTADLYEPCRKPDYWIFPRQDEWILHWCQENKADAYPVYRGPVSLLIENAPSGEDGVSLRSATVTSDTNDNGEAEARESVAWGMEVVLTREGEISGLSGTIQCADPYFETPVSTSFDGRSLYETGEGFGVEVWGTLREDTPPGHVFTFELQAVDEMGDQFTATIQTPPVGESSAQPAFVSVEAPDFFDFSEAGGATASMEVFIENIGGDDIPEARAVLRSEGPYVEVSSSRDDVLVGDIAAGNTAVADWYRALQVTGGGPAEVTTPMVVELTDALDRSWSLGFDWTFYTVPLPVIALEVTELFGDGDGTPEPGEMLNLTFLLKKVSYNTPDTSIHAVLRLGTDDLHLRFSEPPTVTTPVLAEDDVYSWTVPVTVLSTHPGGDASLTVTADLYNRSEILRMTTTQPLSFAVTP